MAEYSPEVHRERDDLFRGFSADGPTASVQGEASARQNAAVGARCAAISAAAGCSVDQRPKPKNQSKRWKYEDCVGTIVGKRDGARMRERRNSGPAGRLKLGADMGLLKRMINSSRNC
ncbi:MAG: hypothetical protein E6H58_00875 [Betaproteobacteria bacterium]|nr:MAG: hypothetical protein E6H58_00875 [Betaproteobacteria bacterium]